MKSIPEFVDISKLPGRESQYLHKKLFPPKMTLNDEHLIFEKPNADNLKETFIVEVVGLAANVILKYFFNLIVIFRR